MDLDNIPEENIFLNLINIKNNNYININNNVEILWNNLDKILNRKKIRRKVPLIILSLISIKNIYYLK